MTLIFLLDYEIFPRSHEIFEKFSEFFRNFWNFFGHCSHQFWYSLKGVSIFENPKINIRYFIFGSKNPKKIYDIPFWDCLLKVPVKSMFKFSDSSQNPKKIYRKLIKRAEKLLPGGFLGLLSKIKPLSNNFSLNRLWGQIFSTFILKMWVEIYILKIYFEI